MTKRVRGVNRLFSHRTPTKRPRIFQGCICTSNLAPSYSIQNRSQIQQGSINGPVQKPMGITGIEAENEDGRMRCCLCSHSAAEVFVFPNRFRIAGFPSIDILFEAEIPERHGAALPAHLFAKGFVVGKS